MLGYLIALLALAQLGLAHDYLEKRICVVYHSVHGLEKESPQEAGLRIDESLCAGLLNITSNNKYV